MTTLESPPSTFDVRTWVCEGTYRVDCNRTAKWVVARPFGPAIYACGIHRRQWRMDICFQLPSEWPAGVTADTNRRVHVHDDSGCGDFV